MKHTFSMRIDKRGRVYLPAAVRRTLNLHPGDRVDVIIEGEQVSLAKHQLTLDEVFASVPPIPGQEGMDLEERMRLAQEEYFAERARKFREM